MKSKIEHVRVEDVLKLERRIVDIDPVREYTLIGVYSFGKGIFHREPKPGNELGNYRFHEICSGDLVLSNIQAWEGAIGVAEERDAGCVGTHRFLTYVPRDDRANTSFLRHFFLSEFGMGLIRKASPGSVMRNRTLGIDAFEKQIIPLPGIDEQRRVAQRIDKALATLRLVKSRSLRVREVAESLKLAILTTAFTSVLDEHDGVALHAIAEINPESTNPMGWHSPTFTYIDIGSVGKGSGRIARPKTLPVEEAPSRARRLVRAGDVLISTVRPNLRGFALVPPAFEGAVCSTGFAVLRPHADLDPDFLLLQAMSDLFVDQLIGEVRGGHYPAVSERRLRNVKVAHAPVPVQRHLVSRLRAQQGYVEELLENRRSSLRRVDSLEISLRNHAFKGEL